MQEVIIKTDKLSKIYSDDKNRKIKAVDSISLDIIKGETFGLVGESGCGKSSLAKLLVKLIRPTKGSIYFKDKDITLLNKSELKEFRKTVQIIFQDPYSSLNPKKTIGWLIKEPLDIHKLYTNQEREEKTSEVLALTGLDDSYKDLYPHQLSGGQRQRVAIAIALILNPEFIICDEAVSALDVSIQAQILNLLNELQEKLNLTYLFISHNLNVVSYISDRIAVMYLGSILEKGTAEDIINKPVHPYTKALFSQSFNSEERIVLQGEIPSDSKEIKGCKFYSRCNYKKDICKNSPPKNIILKDNRECLCHFADEFYNEY